MFLDDGIGALPKVLDANMNEAILPTDPTGVKKTRPSWALIQYGNVVVKYALGCCSVAPKTR